MNPLALLALILGPTALEALKAHGLIPSVEGMQMESAKRNRKSRIEAGLLLDAEDRRGARVASRLAPINERYALESGVASQKHAEQQNALMMASQMMQGSLSPQVAHGGSLSDLLGTLE